MQGCIKTATQSRCTMQRHKWLSMHRCNGTNGCRRKDAPTQTTANARMRDSACPKFRKDAKPKEQARRARMHDSGRTESAQGRTDPNDRNSTTPLHFRPLNKRGIIFGAAGGRTRNLRVRHGCLIKWTPKVSQGCETNRAFINVQRMHDGGRTKSLCKDA